MKTLIPALIVIAVSIILLGIRVLFIKGGKFPSGHIHDNSALKSRGIGCASSLSESRKSHGSGASAGDPSHS